MDEYDDIELRIAKWYAFAAMVPPLLSAGLEHYRWTVKRRDRERKRAFYAHMNKAIDKALDARSGDE